MGFGEQTEDRDLPPYIIVGTEHPDGGTGYYAAARAGLTRVTRIFRDQRDAINAAEQFSRFDARWLPGRASVMEDLMYRDPVNLIDAFKADLAEYARSIGQLSTVDPVLEPEEPAYRRVKTPVEDEDYFTAVGGSVALGVEAPYPLNLSEEQTEQVASALLTFNLLGFRVRLERIHG